VAAVIERASSLAADHTHPLGAPLGHAVGGAADDIAIGILLVFGLYTLIDRDDGEGERVRDLASADRVGRGRARREH
jgi:hypothetical protein